MHHRRPTIASPREAHALHDGILRAAQKTIQRIQAFGGDPLTLLRIMKFEMIGHDPLTGQPLNVIEQLNQTFTILTSLRAVEMLFELHPESKGFRLALTTSSGRDIESVVPNLVSAEVFAATSPRSNRKLAKDTLRLATDTAKYRYIFFSSPGYANGRQPDLESVGGIQVYSIDLT